jgi:hypothetical protein
LTLLPDFADTNRRQSNAGRLDHPSRAIDRIKFPADFGRRFVVYVDTEEEFDWTKPQSRNEVSTTTVQHLPEFQRMMDANGVAPAYLIDHPVAASDVARDTLGPFMEAGACEIGTQLHAWVNPPFDEEVNAFNSFAGNLPRELEQAKLANLTDLIAQQYGQRPTIYRAGRYGIGPNTAGLLEEAGYKLDVSVRPTFDYSSEGGPDFSRHDSRPYWTGPHRQLVELPLGASYIGLLKQFGPSVYRYSKRNGLIGAFARSGLLSRVALTPEDMPVEEAKDAVRAMIGSGIQVLSFSFHSPSLAPGHTPYVRTSADLNDFYRWWDKMFAFLAQYGVTPASSACIVKAAWAAR